jgi:hypothetical protein
MFLRKSKAVYCFYLVLVGTAILGALWTAGLFGTKQRSALNPDALKAALEAVRTKQRAELIGQLADAAHFNSKRLERLSSVAYRLDLLEASGFLAFASQARYHIDREVYPHGIPTSSDRGILYFPPLFWMSGGKPAAIPALEAKPGEYIAAIRRFMDWNPRFDPDYDPGWQYDTMIDDAGREQVVSEVLGRFRAGLQRLADNYADPRYAGISSEYALARNKVVALPFRYAEIDSEYALARNKVVALPFLPHESLPVAEREVHEQRRRDARERLAFHTALMRDALWEFWPETRWHARAALDAADYFDDAGMLGLCHAIEANDVGRMEELIAAGVDVNQVGRFRITALLWAMPDARRERFECLLRHGADPNVPLANDFPGIRHPLLADPSDPLAISFSRYGPGPGDSVMTLACRAPIEILALVLEHGGDPNLRHPVWNEIPLDMVDRQPDRDARLALLLDHGADPQLRRAESSSEL